jgi:predicted Zn-dependent protease
VLLSSKTQKGKNNGGNTMKMKTRRNFLKTLGAAPFVFLCNPASAFDFKKMIDGAKPLAQDAQPLLQSLQFTEEDEIEMGETYYPQHIESGGGLYPDQKAQDALKRFARPLLATSQRKAIKWEISLLKNETVNAWALPGGKLAVHSGLLSYADDPNELASVISHEIGHAELSHGVSQMRTEGFLSTVSSAGKKVLAQYVGQKIPMSGEVLNTLEKPVFQMINAGYSQKREFEADAHILHVFDKTRMDPAKADDFFRTLDRLYPSDTDITTSLFSTHPGTRRRIERIEALASKKTGNPSRSAAPKGWSTLKKLFPTKAS